MFARSQPQKGFVQARLNPSLRFLLFLKLDYSSEVQNRACGTVVEGGAKLINCQGGFGTFSFR